MYIDDIVNDLNCNINLFADDTSLYVIVDDPVTSTRALQSDIDKISNWALTWLVKFNPLKSESLVLSKKCNKPSHPTLKMFESDILSVNSHKHLGLILSSNCTWGQHLDDIKEKAWSRVNLLRSLKHTLDRKSLEIMYFSFIRPILEYSDVVWDNCNNVQKLSLERIQYESARIVTGCSRLVSIARLMLEAGWETLEERRRKHKLVLFYKMTKGLVPEYLASMVPQQVGQTCTYNLRNSNNINTIPSRTSLYASSFLPASVHLWNSLPNETRNCNSINSFKYFLNKDKPKCNKSFYYGKRRLQIIHTRLRTSCSSLNEHLYLKNIVNSPMCRCGAIENAKHFFFSCLFYSHIRPELIYNIQTITTPSTDVILNGDPNTTFENNLKLFDAVHKYIESSGRFD